MNPPPPPAIVVSTASTSGIAAMCCSARAAISDVRSIGVPEGSSSSTRIAVTSPCGMNSPPTNRPVTSTETTERSKIAAMMIQPLRGRASAQPRLPR